MRPYSFPLATRFDLRPSASLVVHKTEMVKSKDLARDHQEVEADRIRQLVRQHEALKKQQRRSEALPGSGILGFLAGWTIMSLLDKDRK